MRCAHNRDTESIANPARQAKSVAQIIFIIILMHAVMVPAAVAQTQYELTWLGDGRPRDINEAGLVTFGWSSYIYNHVTGAKVDLNDPQYGASWLDLEDQANETGQWTVWHSNGINENNEIIGTARHVDGVTADRNFVLYDPLGLAPRFELLPRVLLDGSTYIVCINDTGEVAAGREINNSGVVVTAGGTIRDPIAGDIGFPGLTFTGINDSGMITGYRTGVSSGPPSRRVSGGPIRFDSPYDPEEIQDGGDLILLDSGNATNYHGDVNNFGDVCYSHNGRGFLAISGVDGSIVGTVNLDDIIVNDPSSQAYVDWISTTIFPSGINDAGQIIGQAQVNGEWTGFLLTPIVPGPTITVNDLTINEGNNGTTTSGQFTVTLSELTGEDVVVPYEIIDGTATVADDDYTTTTPGLLTFSFAAGETSKTVEFSIVGDDTNEPHETFQIQLGEAIGGAEVTKGEGTVTIQNDDGPTGGTKTYSSGNIDLAIPDNNPTGASSTIVVGSSEAVSIISLTITLDIDHERSSDLSVTLMDPNGDVVTLTNFLGDNNVTVVTGTSTQGQWTLKAVDGRKKKIGTINSWEIKADY